MSKFRAQEHKFIEAKEEADDFVVGDHDFWRLGCSLDTSGQAWALLDGLAQLTLIRAKVHAELQSSQNRGHLRNEPLTLVMGLDFGDQVLKLPPEFLQYHWVVLLNEV